MAKVLMYSTAVCPYCVRAEQLLLRKGVKDIEKVRVDLIPELREEMMQKTGRRSVPQIYIGDLHVGGAGQCALDGHSIDLVSLFVGNRPTDADPGALQTPLFHRCFDSLQVRLAIEEQVDGSPRRRGRSWSRWATERGSPATAGLTPWP